MNLLDQKLSLSLPGIAPVFFCRFFPLLNDLIKQFCHLLIFASYQVIDCFIVWATSTPAFIIKKLLCCRLPKEINHSTLLHPEEYSEAESFLSGKKMIKPKPHYTVIIPDTIVMKTDFSQRTQKRSFGSRRKFEN